MPTQDTSGVIVIGGSAGGIEATCQVLKNLQPGLLKPVLITIHIGNRPSLLPSVLGRCCILPVKQPKPRELMLPDHIYVAPPDRHLSIEDGRIHLSKGPRENGFRPAIDPLFRSAARWYRSQAVGVIVSGDLDDGVAGLFAIKARGGMALIQDPKEALNPSMPQCARAAVEIDHCLQAHELGITLNALGRRNETMASQHRLHSPRKKAKAKGLLEAPKDQVGNPIPLSCPDCDGPLFEVRNGKLTRFHCLVGHTFSPNSLTEAHSNALQRAIWKGIRTLNERLHVCRIVKDSPKVRTQTIPSTGV